MPFVAFVKKAVRKQAVTDDDEMSRQAFLILFGVTHGIVVLLLMLMLMKMSL